MMWDFKRGIMPGEMPCHYPCCFTGLSPDQWGPERIFCNRGAPSLRSSLCRQLAMLSVHASLQSLLLFLWAHTSAHITHNLRDHSWHRTTVKPVAPRTWEIMEPARKESSIHVFSKIKIPVQRCTKGKMVEMVCPGRCRQ